MFKDIKKCKWGLDKDIDKIWNEMASCIKRVGKEVLGESKGCGGLTKQSWRWIVVVQVVVRLGKGKQNMLSKRLDLKLMMDYITSCDEEWRKEFYRLVKIRKIKTKDLNRSKCIKMKIINL